MLSFNNQAGWSSPNRKTSALKAPRHSKLHSQPCITTPPPTPPHTTTPPQNRERPVKCTGIKKLETPDRNATQKRPFTTHHHLRRFF